MRKRLTIVLSGPSGVGKGTICKKVLEEMDELALSVSCTTRAKRLRDDGTMEEHGVEYFFISEEEFEERVQKGDFYEYADVHLGKRYGTSRSFVEQMKASGKDVLLEIEMQGALKVKAVDPEAVLIYILPPDYPTLRERLINRGSETPDEVEARLKDAKPQLAYADKYDFVVLNDDLQETVEEVKGIIRACTHRRENRLELINKIKCSFE